MSFRAPPEKKLPPHGTLNVKLPCEKCDALIRGGQRFDLQCKYDMGPLQEMLFCPREIQGPGVESKPGRVRCAVPVDVGVEVDSLTRRDTKTEHALTGRLTKKRKRRKSKPVDERQRGLFDDEEC